MKRPRRARGFTLVEVLVAASLLAGLLAAGVALAFQLCSLLAAQADDPVFDRHADGIECFLRSYRSSGADKPMSEVKDEPGLLPRVGLVVPSDAPLLKGKPPVKSGGVRSLAFRPGSGLWLVWPTRGDDRAGSAGSACALLSPWVVGAQVLRYDVTEDKWTVELADASDAPDWRVIRLEMSHAGHRRTLLIPWESRRNQGGGR